MLPIHHVGSCGGGVFAYTGEIEDWLRRNDGAMAAESAGRPSAALIGIPAKGNQGKQLTSRPQQPANNPAREDARKLIDEAYRMWRLVSASNLHSIARSFRAAIDLDPQNPEAHAGLSHALIMQGIYGRLNLASAYSSARFAAETALELDPASAEGRCAMASLKVVQERDWESAREIFQTLLEDHPANPRLTLGRALLHIAEGDLERASDLLYGAAGPHMLCTIALGLHSWSEYLAGEYSEVMEHIAEAQESGQSGPILNGVEALASMQLERPSEAIAHIETLLARDPGNDVARGALGYIAGGSGDRIKAQEVLGDLNSEYSHAKYVPHYSIALVHIGLDQIEDAMRSLVSSYEDGSIWSLSFAVDPALRPLAEEPAFKEFLRVSYPPGVGTRAHLVVST